MEKIKHTPIPWRLAEPDEFPWRIDAPADGGPTLTIVGPGGYGILSAPLCATDGNRENWQFAVKAVNCHDQLVKALEFIAGAERADGRYDKHDMAGAVVTAKRALDAIRETEGA